MFDLVRKSLLTGVGLAAMTKDRVGELARELMEKGEMTEKEGKELLDELLERSEQAKNDLEARVEGIVRKVVDKIPVATKEEIAGLAERITNLEQKVSRSRRTKKVDSSE